MATKASQKKTYKFEPQRTYHFELVGEGANHQGKYIIPSSALVFEDGRYRKVRLSSTESSPYVDEQSEYAITSNRPIIFKKGRLSVDGTQEYLLNYLVTLDHNIEKGDIKIKKLFRYKLVDQELTEKEKAEARKLKLKVQTALSEATKEELSEYLLGEWNFTPQTDTLDELFNKASAYAELDPQHVLNTFKTEEAKLKSKLVLAFNDQVLKNTKGVVTWADTGVEIIVLKPKVDEQITDLLVEWISKNSKEATDFVKKLATKLTV